MSGGGWQTKRPRRWSRRIEALLSGRLGWKKARYRLLTLDSEADKADGDALADGESLIPAHAMLGVGNGELKVGDGIERLGSCHWE